MRSLPPLPLAGFEAFPLRVGVVDLAQSNACGHARRFAGDSAASASACAPKVAPESPPRKDTPAGEEDESSTLALANGEQGFPK